MKNLHIPPRFRPLRLCFVALALVVVTPTAIHAGDTITVENANKAANSDVGSTILGIGKDALQKKTGENITRADNAARWGKLDPTTTEKSLEAADELLKTAKKVDKVMKVTGVLIDNAGGLSTAAGELAEGRYKRGFLTIIDTIGKSVCSTAGGTALGTAGTTLGPAGTAAGAAAGGYWGGKLWDNSVGAVINQMKNTGDKEEDDANERGLSKTGETEAEIHARKLIADQIAKGKKDADDFMQTTAAQAKAKAKAEDDQRIKDFRKAAAAKAAKAAEEERKKALANLKKICDDSKKDGTIHIINATPQSSLTRATKTVVEKGWVMDKQGNKITITEETDENFNVTIIYTATDSFGRVTGDVTSLFQAS